MSLLLIVFGLLAILVGWSVLYDDKEYQRIEDAERADREGRGLYNHGDDEEDYEPEGWAETITFYAMTWFYILRAHFIIGAGLALVFKGLGVL